MDTLSFDLLSNGDCDCVCLRMLRGLSHAELDRAMILSGWGRTCAMEKNAALNVAIRIGFEEEEGGGGEVSSFGLDLERRRSGHWNWKCEVRERDRTGSCLGETITIEILLFYFPIDTSVLYPMQCNAYKS